jgi:hypothetical protein
MALGCCSASSLEALGFDTAVSDYNWPHVWWVPTGPLSHLPLGRYDDCIEAVLDRVILEAMAEGMEDGYLMIMDDDELDGWMEETIWLGA